MPPGQNQAVIRITADDRLLDGILGRVVRKMHAWGVQVQQVVKSSLRGIGDISGFEGLGSMSAAINMAKGYAQSMLELAQTANLTASEQNALRVRLDQVALATGVNQKELLGAVDTYHKFTGHGRDMISMLDEAARVAIATATPVSTVANVMARLKQNVGLTAEQMTSMFNILSVQSDRGAIKMKDMAEVFPTLLGSLQAFGGSKFKNVVDMDAMLQIAAQVSGDPEQAATRLDDLMNMIKTRSSKLEDAGIRVFSDLKKTQRLPLQDIVEQLIKLPMAKVSSALGTDKDEGDVLGRRKQVTLMIDALRDRIDQERALAGVIDDRDSIDRKANQSMQSSVFGFTQFNAVMTKAVNDLFLGRLQTLANILGEIAKFVGVLVDHPLTTLLPAYLAYRGLPSMMATAGLSMATSGAFGSGGQAGFGQVTNVYIVGAAAGVLGGGGAGGAGGVPNGTMRGPTMIQAANAIITAGSIGASIGTMIATVMGFYDYSDDPRTKKTRAEAQGTDPLYNAGASYNQLFAKMKQHMKEQPNLYGFLGFDIPDSAVEDAMKEQGSAGDIGYGKGSLSANEVPKLIQKQLTVLQELKAIFEGAGAGGGMFRPGGLIDVPGGTAYLPSPGPVVRPHGTHNPSSTNIPKGDGYH